MNQNIRTLMEYVARENWNQAKSVCKAIAEENRIKKDEAFCRGLLERMEHQDRFLELPANLKGTLIAEDVRQSFQPERYYLSERERAVADEIEQMYAAAEKLEDLDVRYANTTLLYGESGTGKTQFARYLAYRLGLPLYYAHFSHLVDSLLGETGKNLNRIFTHIGNERCVFLLDEMDAIGNRRGKDDSGCGSEMDRVTISLMQELDQISNRVLLLATTNREDILDDAVKRRFSIRHEVKRLTSDENKQMIQSFLKDIKLPYREEELLPYIQSFGKTTQAIILNDMIRRIAKAVQGGEKPMVSLDREEEQAAAR